MYEIDSLIQSSHTNSMRLIKRKVALFLVLGLCTLSTAALHQLAVSHAAGTACSASVNPHTLAPYSTVSDTVTITNTGDTAINWIKITPPSPNFTPHTVNAPGWSGDTDPYRIILTSGTLANGASVDAQLTIQTVNSIIYPDNWSVLVSTDSSGGGAGPRPGGFCAGQDDPPI